MGKGVSMMQKYRSIEGLEFEGIYMKTYTSQYTKQRHMLCLNDRDGEVARLLAAMWRELVNVERMYDISVYKGFKAADPRHTPCLYVRARDFRGRLPLPKVKTRFRVKQLDAFEYPQGQGANGYSYGVNFQVELVQKSNRDYSYR